jgi:rare lipoprotein A (peptidoglycan hydrolase)
MRPPTVPPTLVRALRATAGLVLATTLAFPALASAATPTPTTGPSLSSLRAERASLVRRIAGLTDKVTRAERIVANARARHAIATLELEPARHRFAQFAVDSFVDGLDDPEEAQLRQKAWADAIAAESKARLVELRRAEDEVVQQQATAEDAADAARDARDELDATRKQLESTITDRENEDKASKHVAVDPAAPTWAVPATRSQSELFNRFAFGTVSDVPAGMVRTGQVLQGNASWYGPGFDGRRTASGAIFDQEGPTVAHKTLPLGTILLITRGDRKVLVLVNDRGPYVAGRIIDLSHGMAAALGTVSAGVAPVTAEILSVAP